MKRTVLFPNVGRRVELVERFRQAAIADSIHLRVIGTDITADAPALHFCDRTYILPDKKRDKSTLNFFQSIVDDCDVDCVVCTIDPDVDFFSTWQDQFQNVNSKKTDFFLSSRKVVDISSDKRETSLFFTSIGVLTPGLIGEVGHEFPIFAKPARGSGSFGAKLINNKKELENYAHEFSNLDPIYMRYIAGKEFSLDCFVTHAQEIFVSVRERCRVRSGEVIVSKTIQHLTLEQEAHRVLSSGGFYGPVTLQAIVEESSGRPYFLEINPRFGGGSILSIEAGMDMPRYMLTGNSQCLSPPKKQLLMMRYDMSVFAEV